MRATFEQAVTLKHVGYDRPCDMYYDNYGNTVYVEYENANSINDLCFLPPCATLDEICNWLREVHGLHVMAMMDTDGHNVKWCAHTQMNIDNRVGFACISTHALRIIKSDAYFSAIAYFNSYDLAQSAAVDRALDILKERIKK